MSDRKQTNHIGHLALTLLTGGLWLPIWWLISAFNMPRDIANQVEDLKDAYKVVRPRTNGARSQITREEAIARGWDPDLLDEVK